MYLTEPNRKFIKQLQEMVAPAVYDCVVHETTTLDVLNLKISSLLVDLNGEQPVVTIKLHNK